MLRAEGLQHGYDLDYAQAQQAFVRALAADPSDPASHRLSAATIWIELLFAQGAITVEDYLGQARTKLPRTPPDPALASAFHEAIGRAIARSEERLQTHPDDASAHYQVGAAYACLASYIATIEGRLLGSLGYARTAYREHERALKLDPRRRDAALVLGVYQYVVANLPAPMRLMARIAGFSGNRQRAIRLVEDAAAYPSDAQPNALFTLILVYNREGRFEDALNSIKELRQRFPRNRLLWLEEGTTALRAGRPADAKVALERGLTLLATDSRPRGLGEEARWHYAHGAALVALGEDDLADASLRRALDTAPADWLRGRVHVELGHLAARAGRSTLAADEYQIANRFCRQAGDDECLKALRRVDPRRH